MIERYAIKVNPAVSQQELVTKLDQMTDPAELRRLHHLKVRIEAVCEAEAVGA
jgi:hypothetical protein